MKLNVAVWNAPIPPRLLIQVVGILFFIFAFTFVSHDTPDHNLFDMTFGVRFAPPFTWKLEVGSCDVEFARATTHVLRIDIGADAGNISKQPFACNDEYKHCGSTKNHTPRTHHYHEHSTKYERKRKLHTNTNFATITKNEQRLHTQTHMKTKTNATTNETNQTKQNRNTNANANPSSKTNTKRTNNEHKRSSNKSQRFRKLWMICKWVTMLKVCFAAAPLVDICTFDFAKLHLHV